MIRKILWVLLLGTLVTFAEDQATFADLAFTSCMRGTKVGVGGQLGIQYGINALTDFELRAVGMNIPEFSRDANGNAVSLNKGSILFLSWYTPYFGDIRPQVGAHFGATYQKGGEIDNVVVDLGAHLRMLFDANDRIRLYFEGAVQAGLGKDGDFTQTIGGGILLRMGK